MRLFFAFFVLLFIILFLHQTTTLLYVLLKFPKLFIILFLHQTTTSALPTRRPPRCLSSCSYIKPQQAKQKKASASVVYHLVPTSNHNERCWYNKRTSLFIILFLHQTTTLHMSKYSRKGCLSSCSYIKPQLTHESVIIRFVVYHLVPTSNHNSAQYLPSSYLLFIILFLHQTTTVVVAED